MKLKRSFSLFLALAMLVTALPMVGVAANTEGFVERTNFTGYKQCLTDFS